MKSVMPLNKRQTSEQIDRTPLKRLFDIEAELRLKSIKPWMRESYHTDISQINNSRLVL